MTLKTLIDFTLRRWLWIALLTSAAMLAIAHAFETFGHLAPCTLCLKQREVYWAALGASAAAIAASFSPLRARTNMVAGLLLAAIFAVGLYIAVWHAGAEWKFWPGPAACSGAGGHGPSAAAMAALVNGSAKLSAPHCDEAAWRFLGLSMAGWNAIISLKLVGWSLIYAFSRQARS